MSRLILDELIEAARTLGHHELLRETSEDTISYWSNRVSDLRGMLLLLHEQPANTFYPNRITRDENGEVTEERLPISEWPAWAAELHWAWLG